MHMVFVHVKSTMFSMHDFTKNIYRILILFDASYVLFPMHASIKSAWPPSPI